MDSNQTSLVVDRLQSIHVFDEQGKPSFCVSIQEERGQPVLSIRRITESGTTTEQPELVPLGRIRRYFDQPFGPGVFACTSDDGQPIPVLVEAVDPIRQKARLRQRNGNLIRYCDQPHVH